MNAITTVEPKDFGLEESKAKELTNGLTTILEERSALAENYKEVIKLEITTETIPQFRELRLRIRDNRTKGIEKWHKVNKEFFLTGGRFVDAIKNKESAENIRMEEALMEGEKHFENLEKEKLAKLNEERIAQIAPYVEDTTGLDLSGMEEDVFEAYLSTKKAKFEAALAEQKRIEEERLENERLDALENKRRFEVAPFAQFLESEPDYRNMTDKAYSDLKNSLLKAKKDHDKAQEEIRLENERLRDEAKAEAEKRKVRNEKLRPYIVYIRDYEKTLNLSDKDFEKELKILSNEAIEQMKFEAEEEKKRQEAKKAQEAKDEAAAKQLRIEREKAERLERAEAARLKAEKEEADKKKAEAAKLAKAPVKEKLTLWVESFELPNVSESNETVNEINAKFNSFKKWAKTEIEKL